MPNYLAPGVYVEEMESGSRPIEGVGTAVAAFVGFAAQGPFNTPTLVTNWSQYSQIFGEFAPDCLLGHSVYGYFLNGGGAAYIVRVGGEQGADDRGPAALGAGPNAILGTYRVVARRTARRGAAGRSERGGHRPAGRRRRGPVQPGRQARRQGRRDLRVGHHQTRQGQRRHRRPGTLDADRRRGGGAGRAARPPQRRGRARPRTAGHRRPRRDRRRRLRRGRRRTYRVRRAGGDRRDHHGRGAGPDGRLPARRDRPGVGQGRADGDDRPL